MDIERLDIKIKAKGTCILNYEKCILAVNCSYIGEWDIVFKSQTKIRTLSNTLSAVTFRALSREQLEITNNFNSDIVLVITKL